MLNKIIHGDTFDVIKTIPDNSVNLVVTSPPYFQQRNYTTNPQEIGKETTVIDYINKLHEIFIQCLRITKEDGSIIFNLGDKYLNGNLCLIPFRFAIKASENAKLINNITWVKKNTTPKHFKRRLTDSSEPFFHFVKSDNYYYNLEKEITIHKPKPNIGQSYFQQIEDSNLSQQNKLLAKKELEEVIQEVKKGELDSFRMKILGIHALPFGGMPGGRMTDLNKKGFTIIKMPGNKMHKDVFEFPTEHLKNNKHPAIFPLEIVKKLITMTTREQDLVFDPFIGSGTTAVAAKLSKRNYSGIEIHKEFITEAEKRIHGT